MPHRLVDPQAGDLISSAQERVQNELLRRTIGLPNSITDSMGTRMVVRHTPASYHILYGTMAADTTTSPTNVTVDGDTISAVLRMLPESGKKYASGTGVYLGYTPDGWEIVSVLACTVDA